MIWKKQDIINDLTKITGLPITEEEYPQGEHYTRDLYITLTNENDGISIVGFDIAIDDISDVDNPSENIPYVEIRNYRSDSDGGLSKDSSKLTRNVYYNVVDYFREKDVEIVDQLKDYF